MVSLIMTWAGTFDLRIPLSVFELLYRLKRGKIGVEKIDPDKIQFSKKERVGLYFTFLLLFSILPTIPAKIL